MSLPLYFQPSSCFLPDFLSFIGMQQFHFEFSYFLLLSFLRDSSPAVTSFHFRCSPSSPPLHSFSISFFTFFYDLVSLLFFWCLRSFSGFSPEEIVSGHDISQYQGTSILRAFSSLLWHWYHFRYCIFLYVSWFLFAVLCCFSRVSQFLPSFLAAANRPSAFFIFLFSSLYTVCFPFSFFFYFLSIAFFILPPSGRSFSFIFSSSLTEAFSSFRLFFFEYFLRTPQSFTRCL